MSESAEQPPALPEPVRELIAGSIDSIAELEALLLLFNEPDAGWATPAVARRLYVGEAAARDALARLATHGLVGEADGVWRFAPASPEIAAAVAELASIYARRLVAITALIHGKSDRALEAFARAFVLRRKE